MPESPLREPLPVPDLDAALTVLRSSGGRVSAPRRAILAVLFEASGPKSSEQIAAAAVPPLDVASTYRSLEYLERVGLVRHVHLGHGPGLYELVGPSDREYTVCEVCGTATSFPPEQIDAAREQIERQVGLRPRFDHFPLVGRCSRCLAEGRSPED